MGRCQSTPGLIETKGRTPIEDMWLGHPFQQPTSAQQILLRYNNFSQKFIILYILINFIESSRAPSPRSVRDERHKISDSPGSLSPSVHSSDERPRSRNICNINSRPQSQPSRTGNNIYDKFLTLFLYY